MEFEEAFDRYIINKKDTDALKSILQDAYRFLESQNYHTHIEVIEGLTGVNYE